MFHREKNHPFPWSERETSELLFSRLYSGNNNGTLLQKKPKRTKNLQIKWTVHTHMPLQHLRFILTIDISISPLFLSFELIELDHDNTISHTVCLGTKKNLVLQTGNRIKKPMNTRTNLMNKITAAEKYTWKIKTNTPIWLMIS